MKINCEIIKDLLPLYHDDVCSKKSKEMISEHLQHCEKCKEELRLMKISFQTPNIEMKEPDAIQAASTAWKKGRHRSFFTGCFIVALAVIFAFGIYIGVHWFSSVAENNLDALAQQAADYFNCDSLRIEEIKQRGNYLALLLGDENNELKMCVFERDDLFKNRWIASGGKPHFSKGEIVSWNFGSPNREAVLIFCGENITQKAWYYTFENSGITYLCPIEDNTVLDIFIIPDHENINGHPVLLDSDLLEIK